MANVVITIREYTVKSSLTLDVVVDKSTFFRRMSGGDKNDIKTVDIKENDIILRINNSFYLKRGTQEYILLEIKDNFITNNPKIFEVKEVVESVVK